MNCQVMAQHDHQCRNTRFCVKTELTIGSEPIGQGRERTCYLHPQDPRKIIKISTGGETTQSNREVEFFENLRKRGFSDYTHLPRFYGTVSTNFGPGLVLDLVCDHDGNISRSLEWHIDNGMSIAAAEKHLEKLHSHLHANLIIFNHDLCCPNILLQRNADQSSQLVIIDGLGDVVSIAWLNRFPSHVRSKIDRRWSRFMQRFYAEEFVLRRQRQDT